jgi:hypothetical protein
MLGGLLYGGATDRRRVQCHSTASPSGCVDEPVGLLLLSHLVPTGAQASDSADFQAGTTEADGY